MHATLNPDIEQAKCEGESDARWDFGHVGPDVAQECYDKASGFHPTRSAEPTRKALASAVAEHFGADMERERMEANASERETVDLDESRAYARAYVQTYAAFALAECLSTRREMILARWDDRPRWQGRGRWPRSGS